MDKRRKKDIAQQRAILHQTIENCETLHEGIVLKESHVLDQLIMDFYKDKPVLSEESQEDQSSQADMKTSAVSPACLPANKTEKD